MLIIPTDQSFCSHNALCMNIIFGLKVYYEFIVFNCLIQICEIIFILLHFFIHFRSKEINFRTISLLPKFLSKFSPVCHLIVLGKRIFRRHNTATVIYLECFITGQNRNGFKKVFKLFNNVFPRHSLGHHGKIIIMATNRIADPVLLLRHATTNNP